jgi:hypothetical protein
MRMLSHPVARTLVAGVFVGLLVLGVGGRIVMAAITAKAGGTPRYTVEGTLTVVMLGAASGLAGAVLAMISRAVATRLLPRFAWTQYLLLGALLLLVTMRGLRGTAPAGSGYFYLLVAIYGLILAIFIQRRNRSPDPATGQSQRP